MDTMEEMVALLLRYARPGGPAYKRLKKIEDQLKRNVMIGPKSRKFLNELRSKLDNIECKYISRKGMCLKKIGRRCEFRDAYNECADYLAVRGFVAKNPLTTGGK